MYTIDAEGKYLESGSNNPTFFSINGSGSMILTLRYRRNDDEDWIVLGEYASAGMYSVSLPRTGTVQLACLTGDYTSGEFEVDINV